MGLRNHCWFKLRCSLLVSLNFSFKLGLCFF
ncbi:hypothetical protein Golob_011734 [Gossypium lobatum]|uniref:Uncharacterized protein n=1 Tax=Gossypium lobatum TaxID=34289 RepID=A0A7J8MQU2_9ROSI|nr:hypothetical protein [Gossypium lobatum]